MNGMHEKSGFTLIEVLIVVILLGITATIIAPNVSVGTDDAKVSALKSNLRILRHAVQLYHRQHNQNYPGARDAQGDPSATPGSAASSFIKQLTRYTDVSGKVSSNPSPVYAYGPYLKSDQLPLNPFNGLASLKCDITATQLTAAVTDGLSGWIFYARTGILLANDGSHDAL